MDWQNLPTLNSLRALSALAETGSLAEAAKRLNVTYPAVSQQVKALEAYLDTALLQRSATARNAPYPRRNSGGAFETGPAKFGHPVKDPDGDPDLCLLVLERPRLQLGPDDRLPAPH